MQIVNVKNLSHALAEPLWAEYCDRFLCKLRGLAWKPNLHRDRGLVLVEKRESRMWTAVHMLGMAFDLAIVWIDSQMCVIDIRLAKKRSSFIIPNRPAQFVMECSADRLDEFSLGDQIAFETTNLD